MRRLLSTVLALTALASGLTLAGRASAQEIQLTGPLAGAPAVRHLRKYREGRFEIAPTISFTLLDEYRRTILVGGRLQYNITEWLAIGAWGGYGVIQSTTSLTDNIDNPVSGAVRNSRTAVNINHANPDGTGYAPFEAQVAKMQWVFAPQLQFTPFRGKLAIFQKVFVDTDAYIHAGPAFVGLQERPDCGAGGTGSTACTDPKSFTLAGRTAITGTFGLGLDFYITNFLSLGVEYRALPFSWNRAGFDSHGAGPNNNFPDNKVDSQDRTFKFNQMITIAFGFGLPAKPSISD